MDNNAYIGIANLTFDACGTCKFAHEDTCVFENESPDRIFELDGRSLDNLTIICKKYETR